MFRTILRLLSNKIILLFTTIITVVCSYYTLQMKKLIPAKDTFFDSVLYAFKNADTYFSTLGLSAISLILCIFVGIGFIIAAIKLYEEYTLIVCIPVGFVGLGSTIAGVYFFNYVAILIAPVIAIIFAAWLFIWFNNQ